MKIKLFAAMSSGTKTYFSYNLSTVVNSAIRKSRLVVSFHYGFQTADSLQNDRHDRFNPLGKRFNINTFSFCPSSGAIIIQQNLQYLSVDGRSFAISRTFHEERDEDRQLQHDHSHLS